MTDLLAPASTVHFSAAQLHDMSARHGFGLRFVGSTPHEGDTVFQGRLLDRRVRPGLTLVCSDIHIAHGYETTAEQTGRRLSIAALLDGAASLRVAHQQAALTAGHAVGMLFDDRQSLQALHGPGQRVRGINVSVEVPEAAGDDALAQLLEQALARPALPLQRRPLPPHLRLGIEHMLASPWQGAMAALQQEALSLQLLAHALAPAEAAEQPAAAMHRLTPRDRRLLARVRERLEEEPGHDHRLDALARLACMSPTTLREKFRVAYGQPVFAFLRERRMQRAREGLAQGWSVQEAAHFVGYAHASNFATAFRTRFGRAPSELCRDGRGATDSRRRA